MMTGNHTHEAPGAPFPRMDVTPPDEMEISTIGQYDAGAGAKIILHGDELIFMAAFDGNEARAGINIDLLLQAIGKFTRDHES